MPEFLVGKRLRVVGKGGTVGGGESSGRVTVVVAPGAFGSGEHETTASCLEALEEIPGLIGSHVLDLGSGTGILAIAALGLGAARAVCVDVDERAVATARHNCELNGVAGRVTHVHGTLADVGSSGFDVALANLHGELLVTLAESLVAAVRPGGYLVLSGILWEDDFTVRQRYEVLGCSLESHRFLEEYATLVFRRP